MSRNLLIICDPDETFCKKLDSFLRQEIRIPFEIKGFTEVEGLKALENKSEALLVISEKLFLDKLAAEFKNILILDEEPAMVAEGEADFRVNDDVIIHHTPKYQSGDCLLRSILSMCLNIPGLNKTGVRTYTQNKMRIIGFYTPDKTCRQTTEALQFAKALAEKERVLYINNDALCEVEEIRGSENEENICDLVYFLGCDKEKFDIYLEKVTKRLGSLFYIPSASGAVRDLDSEDYISLLGSIESSKSFESIVIDFSESFKGIIDALKECDILVILYDGSKESQNRLKLFEDELNSTDGIDISRIMKVAINETDTLLVRYQSMIHKGEY